MADKEKELKMEKEFKRGYVYEEFIFEPELIAWINAPQIDQDISVQT